MTSTSNSTDQPPRVLRGLADIRAIESQSHALWLAAASSFDLLRQSARQWPDAAALVYLQTADDFEAGTKNSTAHDDGTTSDDGTISDDRTTSDDNTAIGRDAVLTWSHAKLLADVCRAARLFRSLGVQRDSPVALLVPHMPSAHIALWAAELAGCAFPINYLLNAEHVAQLLRAAQARVVVALGPVDGLSIHDTVGRAVSLAGCIEHVLWVDANEAAPGADSFQARLRSWPGHWDELELPGGQDLAALFHTGGTTGLPKLLRHTHGNQVHTSRAATAFYDFGPGDRIMNAFPLFHVAGAFVYGLSCLAAGGSLFIPTLAGLRNPAFVRSAWTWLGRCAVTHLGCVPTALAALLGTPRTREMTPKLRVALTGGSPLPTELAVRFERETGLPVRNIFGMTECAGIVSIEPVGAPRTPNSVGLRLPYTEVVAVSLADASASRVTAGLDVGQTGVLALRGPHVSPGYLDATRNSGTFTDDGWLLTGDLGHVDAQGRIFITGRAKDLIIRSSHNIDPGLIEDAFLAHPSVMACAAVGEPDAYAGELPVVYVSLKAGAQLTPEALLEAVSGSIAERPAVPKRVTIVQELPMTPIGKIFKPALRALAARTKVSELLAAVTDAGVEVNAEERSGRMVVTVAWASVAGPAASAAVGAVVGAAARSAVSELPIEVEFVDQAGA